VLPSAPWNDADDLLDHGTGAASLDVLAWWRDSAADFPTLAPVARHALSALVVLPPSEVDNPAELCARIRESHVRTPVPAPGSLHTVGNIRQHAYIGNLAREAPAPALPHTMDTECPETSLREVAQLCSVNSEHTLELNDPLQGPGAGPMGPATE
jgi:hypothetical protein